MARIPQRTIRKLPPAIVGVLIVAAVLMALSRAGLFRDSPTLPDIASETLSRPMLHLPAAALKPGYRAVARVVDGDTLLLDGRERVRLIGVDCPEIDRESVDPQGDGFRATMFVFELLKPDAQVRLEYDTERLDRYDRTFVYVYLPDGRMLNEVLLEHGWADVMRIAPNTKHARRFAALRDEADHAGRGMWAD